MFNNKKILLLCSSFNYNEAVSRDVQGMYHALQGLDTKILSGDGPQDPHHAYIEAGQAVDWLSDDGIIIYHCDAPCQWADDLFLKAGCYKILRPHTMACLGTPIQDSVQKTKDAMSPVARYADAVLVPSCAYNAVLQQAGYNGKLYTQPLFHHTDKLQCAPFADDFYNALNDGRVNIILLDNMLSESVLNCFAKTYDADGYARPAYRFLLVKARGALPESDDELPENVVVINGDNISELATAYRAASLLVVADEKAAYQHLLAAMAFGVPVLAFNTPGLAEIVAEAGVLYKDASNDLHKGMVNILTNSGLHGSLRAKGWERYLTNYDIDSLDLDFLTVMAQRIPHKLMHIKHIHQFHNTLTAGDAISNSLFFMQGMLRELGFESEIYASRFPEEFKNKVKHYTTLPASPHEALIFHHSMATGLEQWMDQLQNIIFLAYHNLTPAAFFADNNPLYNYIRHNIKKGLDELQFLIGKSQAAIADSPFNAGDLVKAGCRDIEVIAALTDIAGLEHAFWNDRLVQMQSEVPTILFVGRIVPNKGQLDLVKVALYLRTILQVPFQLVLVGGYDEKEYYFQKIIAEVEQSGLQDYVRITGKVSDEDLYGWYRAADVFLCMSEHEGFCVPLLESMVLGLPVVAYDSSAIKDTLGSAGIMVEEKNHAAIAALVKILLGNRSLRTRIAGYQKIYAQKYKRDIILKKLSNFLLKQGIAVPEQPTPGKNIGKSQSQPHYQIEGPFESSYSLALGNRELAIALDKKMPGEVALFATEGWGDYPADQTAMKRYPGVDKIWERGKKRSGADVVIRQLYPTRVGDMDGKLNFLFFAWEETGIPAERIRQFNHSLDGIMVYTNYVYKVLRDNGVYIPIINCGAGAEHIIQTDTAPLRIPANKKFKFLHISSGLPRKGVDILLAAYARLFNKNDEVELIIKTIPNPQNNIVDLVQALRKESPACPAITVIQDDYSQAEIKSLYLHCDALVAPSRGEGFGLPMAEAILLGKPVITTAYGGHCDFCTEETAWLVDFDFAPSRSHLDLISSIWLEPKVDSLVQKMREVYEAAPGEIKKRVKHGQKILNKNFTWDVCAQRTIEFEKQVSRLPEFVQPVKMAFVSSWNSKCGIASYSSFILEHFDPMLFDMVILSSNARTLNEDSDNVYRCWGPGFGGIDPLLKALNDLNPHVVFMQHNFAFFNPEELGRILDHCDSHNIPSVITLHRTEDDVWPNGYRNSLSTISASLKKAARLLVHSVNDLNRLKNWGVKDNISFLPHGVVERPNTSKADARKRKKLSEQHFIISTYGFFLPHKGFVELLEAFLRLAPEFPNARLLMANALYGMPETESAYNKCKKILSNSKYKNRVTLISDYLADEESFEWLECSDVIVFPYQETAESSSAAVRFGLASHRPILCTPLAIFDDVADVVRFFSGTNVDHLTQGLRHVMLNKDELNSIHDRQERWLQANSWPQIAYRLSGMLRGLHCDKHNK